MTMPVNSGNGDAPLIRLRNVVKTYHAAAGDVHALKATSAEFHRGEFVGIVGKSGAGKSTLVNVISGVDRVTSGEIWVGDAPVHALNENEMALWRGLNVGVVFQFFELLATLSLLENVMLPMDFCGLYKPRQSRERAMRLLEQVEIAEHARKTPSRVSGGQQQRAAIARALANDPAIIVADEPTGNLDSATAETIFQLFESLVEQGKTILMVTHDNTLAGRFSRTLQIVDGEIVADARR